MQSYFKITIDGQDFKFLKLMDNVSSMDYRVVGADKKSIHNYYYQGDKKKRIYYPDVLYYFIHMNPKISSLDKKKFAQLCGRIAKKTELLNNSFVFIQASNQYIKNELLEKNGSFGYYFYTDYHDITKGEALFLQSYLDYKSICEDYEAINEALRKKYGIKKNKIIAYTQINHNSKPSGGIALEDYNKQKHILSSGMFDLTLFLECGEKLIQEDKYFSSRTKEINNFTLNKNLIEALGKKVINKEKGTYYFLLDIQSQDTANFKLGLASRRSIGNGSGSAEDKYNFSNLNDVPSFKTAKEAYNSSNYRSETGVLMVKNGVISQITTLRALFKEGFEELRTLIERANLDSQIKEVLIDEPNNTGNSINQVKRGTNFKI